MPARASPGAGAWWRSPTTTASCSWPRTPATRSARSARSTTGSASPASASTTSSTSSGWPASGPPTSRATSTAGTTWTPASLANQYAQILGQVFTHELKPMEVEILVAEVGVVPAGDVMFHVLYDGTVFDEHTVSVLGGDADTVTGRVEAGYRECDAAGRGGEAGGDVAGRPRSHAARRPSWRLRCWPAATGAAASTASKTTSWPGCWPSRADGRHGRAALGTRGGRGGLARRARGAMPRPGARRHPDDGERDDADDGEHHHRQHDDPRARRDESPCLDVRGRGRRRG